MFSSPPSMLNHCPPLPPLNYHPCFSGDISSLSRESKKTTCPALKPGSMSCPAAAYKAMLRLYIRLQDFRENWSQNWFLANILSKIQEDVRSCPTFSRSTSIYTWWVVLPPFQDPRYHIPSTHFVMLFPESFACVLFDYPFYYLTYVTSQLPLRSYTRLFRYVSERPPPLKLSFYVFYIYLDRVK